MLRPLLPNFGPPGSLAKTGVVAGQKFLPRNTLQPAPKVLEISARVPFAKIENGGPFWIEMSVLACQPPTTRLRPREMLLAYRWPLPKGKSQTAAKVKRLG